VESIFLAAYIFDIMTHSSPSYTTEINFNITLPPHAQVFRPKCRSTCDFSHAHYLFNHPNNIWWRTQILKLFIMRVL